MNRRQALALAAVAAVVLPACSRPDLSGPPDLRVGRDECAECGMIISEDRCCSALLIEQGGRREYVMFDDIGCMLDYERHKGARFTRIDSFVRDHNTRQWVRSADAHFLFADREVLLTPMGTGIVAYADRDGAQEKQREVGGDILDERQLAEARREWMWARYGKPAGTP